MTDNIDQCKGIKDLFLSTRKQTEQCCQVLTVEDHNIQGMPDVSPPKWHLAHTTWFYETFLMKEFVDHYEPYDPIFEYLFNSYYEQVGPFHPRSERGLLCHPSLDSVWSYRRYVEDHLCRFLDAAGKVDDKFLEILEIGIHHEMQHQELLLMDIKYNYFKNPLHPVYCQQTFQKSHDTLPYEWLPISEGVYEVGAQAKDSFYYDNEAGCHRVFIEPVTLANRLVSNGEFLSFIESGGYVRSDLWLSDGWQHINQIKLRHPLYWIHKGDTWYEFTLHGEQELDLNAPVSHISYYEADAFARWAEARLPTEFEWEVIARTQKVSSPLLDFNRLHPYSSSKESLGLIGNLWQWTSSSYSPYPKYKPELGALGEYNGKFMCNQYVLRGGSYGTPRNHIRPTYRNFFPAHSQWMFSGIRLARED